MSSKTAIILTFSKNDNRGANLQAYALKKTLEDMGVNVRFLDIQLPRKRLNFIGQIDAKVKNFCAERFRKRTKFKYTTQYKNVQELETNPPEADIFIVGSDQVWNPDLTHSLDPRVYFFSFLKDNTKRISYAASFGKSEWTATKYDKDIAELLSRFSHISVREDTGVDICKNIFQREDVKVCIDPSLLLKTADVQQLIRGKTKSRKQIYCYLLYKSSQVYDIVDEIASQTRLAVIGDPRNGNSYTKLRAIHGVEKWIRNVVESELIVTNSFHTMVVSILLRKNFVVVPPIDGRETRLISLLSKLGLLERYINYGDNINIASMTPIDYDSIESKLDILRSLSLKFINNAIK